MDAAEGGDLGRELFSKLERDRGATEGKAIKRLHEERSACGGWVDSEREKDKDEARRRVEEREGEM